MLEQVVVVPRWFVASHAGGFREAHSGVEEQKVAAAVEGRVHLEVHQLSTGADVVPEEQVQGVEEGVEAVGYSVVSGKKYIHIAKCK